MNIRFLRVLCLPLLVTAPAFANDDVPQRPDFHRYVAMLKKSPFAVATAQAVAAPTPNFAKDLYVANVARTSDGALVTVQSAVDRNLKEYLTSKGPNEHGYAISGEIQWSDKPGQTKVPISKDGQFATLGFNQTLIAQPLPAGPQPVQPVPQPVVPAPAYVPPKPFNQGAMTPQPHMRGLIQRNPSAAGAQQQQQPQQQRPVPDSEQQ